MKGLLSEVRWHVQPHLPTGPVHRTFRGEGVAIFMKARQGRDITRRAGASSSAYGLARVLGFRIIKWAKYRESA